MIEGRVDIITRTKNRTLLLERAIQTVLDQSYQNWNHIIVNDGGTPSDVEALVDKYRNKYQGRISILHHQQSVGMEAASNAGINIGEGEFIVILDDDDTWETDFLKKTVLFLQNKPHLEIAGVISWANIVKEKIVDNSIHFISKKKYTKDLYYIDFSEIIKNNLFTTNSFLFQRKALDTCGLFDATLPVLGDWDFNIRFLNYFEIGVIPEYLSNYHQRPIDKNSNTSNSIFGGHSRHMFYQTYVRNKYLREDIKQGKVGIGVLMTILKNLHGNEVHLKELRSSSVKNRLKNTIKNFINK